MQMGNEGSWQYESPCKEELEQLRHSNGLRFDGSCAKNRMLGCQAIIPSHARAVSDSDEIRLPNADTQEKVVASWFGFSPMKIVSSLWSAAHLST